MGLKLNTKSKILGVFYTIRGIYGDVEYVATYNIKDGEVCGVDSFETLMRADQLIYDMEIDINPMLPRFDVRIKTDLGDINEEKLDIVGSPLGLTKEDYFRMAQLREMKNDRKTEAKKKWTIKDDNGQWIKDAIDTAILEGNKKVVKELHDQLNATDNDKEEEKLTTEYKQSSKKIIGLKLTTSTPTVKLLDNHRHEVEVNIDELCKLIGNQIMENYKNMI